MLVLLLQVISLLGALAVIAPAVPVSGVEESYGHIAVEAAALPPAPALHISHAPIAIAHAPVIKEVEHHVRITLFTLTLCKKWIEMESLIF
jgi:hypothetical protein